LLHSVVRGEGTAPILLLHGFLGSHRNLGALVRAIEARFMTIALDLPGHGRSPPLPENADIETMASAVLEAIAALRLELPVKTVGHSLGGRVALMAKRLAPHSLEPITLLDISASPTKRKASELAGVADALRSAPESTATREEMRQQLARTLTGPIVEWLLLNVKREGGRFAWAIDREAMFAFDQRASQEDLWDVVDDSITVLRGSASPYVSDEDAARFESLGARVVTIPNAGHFVHVDATEEVAAAT
jgi:esterase